MKETHLSVQQAYRASGIGYARTHPLQTPTNISQSQLTDPEEIYDSVRSLSQAALSDSLNLKKEQARLVQQQAVKEFKDHSSSGYGRVTQLRHNVSGGEEDISLPSTSTNRAGQEG